MDPPAGAKASLGIASPTALVHGTGGTGDNIDVGVTWQPLGWLWPFSKKRARGS